MIKININRAGIFPLKLVPDASRTVCYYCPDLKSIQVNRVFAVIDLGLMLICSWTHRGST